MVDDTADNNFIRFNGYIFCGPKCINRPLYLCVILIKSGDYPARIIFRYFDVF